MKGKWTFGRRIAAGFAAASVTLIALVVVGYQSTHSLIQNDRSVSHTQQVRRDIGLALSLLKDAETGERGFIITGDEAFLEPFEAARAGVDRTVDELRALIADNPQQRQALTMVRPLIDRKMDGVRALVAQRRAGSDKVNKELVVGGKATMDRIRRVFAEMDDREQDLLSQRRDDAEQSARTAKATLIRGGALGVLMVILIGVFITRSLAAQIGTAVSHVQSSSAELQSAANQQATGAKEQATAMTEIATTISELLATSRQIAESAQRVAQIAERAVEAARTGDAIVDRGQGAVVGIRRQVDLIVTHMLELGKKSQQIGAVLDIVSELAEQTNILAINATIEAAGAGEAGKRFAVVADEIRKLADRVTGSTKDVRALIDDVRSAVNTTVMTTETGSKAAESGAREFTEVAGAFNEIVTLVAATTEAAKEIELSTKQQASAVEQVNVAIANVTQTTKESEASSSQTLQTASQLTLLSRDLIRIVQPEADA
jgi:methyl-accepting chemotaxis protein